MSIYGLTAANKQSYKKWYLQVKFDENPANDATMYSRHFQRVRRNRLQAKFCVSPFLIKIYVQNYSCFSFDKRVKFFRKTIQFELNLNVQYGRVFLFTVFTSWKNYRKTCAILCSEKGRTKITPPRPPPHPTSNYQIRLIKISI